jgi:hypothetical protein
VVRGTPTASAGEFVYAPNLNAATAAGEDAVAPLLRPDDLISPGLSALDHPNTRKRHFAHDDPARS